MFEDLQLNGYSESTQKLYVSAVRQLCEHFNNSPGTFTHWHVKEHHPEKSVFPTALIDAMVCETVFHYRFLLNNQKIENTRLSSTRTMFWQHKTLIPYSSGQP